MNNCDCENCNNIENLKDFMCVDCHLGLEESETYEYNGHAYCEACQASNAREADENALRD